MFSVHSNSHKEKKAKNRERIGRTCGSYVILLCESLSLVFFCTPPSPNRLPHPHFFFVPQPLTPPLTQFHFGGAAIRFLGLRCSANLRESEKAVETRKRKFYSPKHPRYPFFFSFYISNLPFLILFLPYLPLLSPLLHGEILAVVFYFSVRHQKFPEINKQLLTVFVVTTILVACVCLCQ